jgi:hypothetical protein
MARTAQVADVERVIPRPPIYGLIFFERLALLCAAAD